jgi:hypothetical protein
VTEEEFVLPGFSGGWKESSQKIVHFLAWINTQSKYMVCIIKFKMVAPKFRGFVLIAAISVLLLLTLVAVAFLSLSALTVRSSRSDWAQEEARAKARLGLMIAMGELQRDLGPDQRIALSASILDQKPG